MTTHAQNPEIATALGNVRQFFLTTISCFDEEDSSFQATPDTYSVAHHVAHTALTIDWFLEGAFGAGWDMDFETHDRQARAVNSLVQAKDMFEKSVQRAIDLMSSKSPEELQSALPADGIMGGAPRSAIVSGIADHTAHHRGALTVYARLCKKVPPMPYA